MSVVVEAFTLVSRRETIERAYPGGVFGFRLDFPDSFAADEHLLRMGSTDPSQVRVTVDRLQELGVQYASRYEYLEMAVVLQGVGTSAGCSWLRFERRDDCSVCWLEGEEEGTLATPPGWTPERSRGWDEWTDGPELQVHGSGNLAQTLIRHSLVDEYRLWVFPLVIGSGKRLFADGTIPAALRLLDSKVSTTGVVISTYEPAGEIVTGSF
jgi:hypothetical protein